MKSAVSPQKVRTRSRHTAGWSALIAYWIASGRRIVLLTTFVKNRMREVREADRARRALARCIAEDHTLEDEDDG